MPQFDPSQIEPTPTPEFDPSQYGEPELIPTKRSLSEEEVKLVKYLKKQGDSSDVIVKKILRLRERKMINKEQEMIEQLSPLEVAAARVRGTSPAPLTEEQRDIIGEDIFEKIKGVPVEAFKGAMKLGRRIAGKPTTPVEAQFGSGLDILEEAEGKNVDEIKTDLLAQGLSTDEAENAILQAVEDLERQSRLTPGRAPGRFFAKVGEEELPLAVGMGAGLKAGQLLVRGGRALLGAGKLARAGTFLGQRAVEGAVAETGFRLASEGDLPEPEEAAIASAVDVALGTAGAAVKGIAKSIVRTRRVNATLDEPMEKVLKNIPDKKKINRFIETAKRSAKEIKEPESVFKLSDDALKKDVAILKKEKAEVGKQIGETIRGLKGTSIEGTGEILDNFKEEVAKRFDLDLTLKKNRLTLRAKKGSLKTTPTKMRNRIKKTFKDLIKLDNVKDAKAADDVKANLKESIDFGRSQLMGKVDRLEGLLRTTSEKISKSVRKVSKKLATEQDRFAHLMSIEERLGTEAGKNLQHTGLLFRRASLSSDKGFVARGVLKDLADITGRDLRDDAYLGRFVLEQFAPQQAKTLFERGVELGKDISFGGAKAGALSLLKNLLPDISKADPDVLVSKLLADERTAGQIFVDLLSGNTTRAIQSLRRLAPEIEGD